MVLTPKDHSCLFLSSSLSDIWIVWMCLDLSVTKDLWLADKIESTEVTKMWKKKKLPHAAIMWCEPCWHWLDIPYVIIVYVWYTILINIYINDCQHILSFSLMHTLNRKLNSTELMKHGCYSYSADILSYQSQGWKDCLNNTGVWTKSSPESTWLCFWVSGTWPLCVRAC